MINDVLVVGGCLMMVFGVAMWDVGAAMVLGGLITAIHGVLMVRATEGTGK